MRHRPTLPLAVWAGALCASTVLGTTAVAACGIALLGRLGTAAAEALAAGAVAGLLLSSLSVLAARRLAAAVRSLHADAQCLADGGRRARETHPPVVRLTRELEDLAAVLDALQLRARVADELGERHRRDAAQTAAGVQELLAGLVTAEEGVRGQLAAELHDTVAQSLLIASSLLAESAQRVDLPRVRDHVQDAEEQVRAVMARARPPALRDGDLAAAVDCLRADMRARYALEVHLVWPDDAAPLPLAAAITLYRFFQEALLNVVKHADVDDAHAELRLEVDAVVATVRDDGPGFEPDQVRPDRGRHVGLGLLSERARLSGGWLEVSSGSGSGTVLQLRLPRRAPGPALVPVPPVPVATPGDSPTPADGAPVHLSAAMHVPAQRAPAAARSSLR